MKEENLDHTLTTLEARVAALENRVFGDEINSKLQQQRKVVEEITQINGQIIRSVASRETVATLMKDVESLIDYMDLEESSELLGGEAKGNALLTAEPVIRQMHMIIKRINMDHVHQAVNSEAIRKITSFAGQLSQLRLVQLEQEDKYRELCTKIDEIEEVLNIMGSAMGR